jgi:hypothetical protein
VLFDGFDVSRRSSDNNGIFCTAIAAVFAEEIDDFGVFVNDGLV